MITLEEFTWYLTLSYLLGQLHAIWIEEHIDQTVECVTEVLISLLRKQKKYLTKKLMAKWDH